MLKLENLSFSYGNNTIFDNVYLTIKQGELTIIKGESGSGKTTLLDILSLKYDIYFDFKINNQNLNNIEVKNEYLNKLCYMSQNPEFCIDLTLNEQWNILKEMYSDNEQLEDYIVTLGLSECRNLYPSQLSGGEKLRAFLISLLIIKPHVILMDEPTASLDDEYKIKFIELLNVLKENSYLIVATHDPHLFDEGDSVYEVKNSQLISLKHNNDKEEGSVIKLKVVHKIKWFRYFFKMKKHHKLKEIFTLILVSLTVSLCAFSVNIDNGFLTVFEENLESMNDRDILVYKALDAGYPAYDFDITGSTYFPITDEEQKNILEVKHVQKMKPKIILSTYIDQMVAVKQLPSFYIMKGSQQIYNYKDTIELLKSQNETYFSTFIEGIEDNEIGEYITQKFSNEKNGIYLNQGLLNRCNIEVDSLKGCSIKIKIGVPRYDISGNSAVYTPSADGGIGEDDDFAPANLVYCKPLEITLPINGVITTGYESDMLVSPDFAMYMSSDALETIARSQKVDKGYTAYKKDTENGFVDIPSQKDADLTLIYTPWQPNTYTVEVDHIKNIKSVVDELENMGYTVSWKYNNYQDYGESIRSTKEMMQMISYAFLLFTTVILSVSHFIKGKEEHQLNSWLHRIGYNQRKTIMYIKSQKYLLNSLITSIMSYIVLWTINLISIYVYYRPYVINMKSVFVIVLISFVTQMIIPMVWEVTYRAKN